MPPEKLRRATLELLEQFVVKRAANGPVLLVFEDMHWSDPSTALWLERIIPIIENLPVLAIVTFRPEFEWSAESASNVTTLALPRLGREQIAQIVAYQAGTTALLPSLVESIVERSEGIPLFCEELTRAILELDEAGDAVPSTLQASLTGRLDRLGPAREVAQAAAVLGRDFDRDLLAEILSYGPRALGDALNALLASKLVMRRAAGSPGALQFKHALVRDAAYDSSAERAARSAPCAGCGGAYRSLGRGRRYCSRVDCPSSRQGRGTGAIGTILGSSRRAGGAKVSKPGGHQPHKKWTGGARRFARRGIPGEM